MLPPRQFTLSLARIWMPAVLILTGCLGDSSGSMSADDPVLVGAGDIADCNSPFVEQTALMVEAIPGTVFVAGDNAYPSGTTDDYSNCYAPHWGRFKDRTLPAPGNHEYETTDASPYFDYFEAAAGERGKGYYSYNRGTWHILALNSSLPPQSRQAQLDWLKADLARSGAQCTLSYFHYPLFSSGAYASSFTAKPIWDILYSAGVDVVVNGHDHLYERFAPQDPQGRPDPTQGIRQFTVGTGGAALHHFVAVQPTSEVRNDEVHGVLKLTLHAHAYSWQFISTGPFSDSGTTSCH